MKKHVFVAFIFYSFIVSAYSQRIPVVDGLALVSQEPGEQSKAISAITFHEALIWCLVFDKAARGKGQYAVFNPQSGEWKYSDSEISQKAILALAQPFGSPSGLVFVGSKLWISGAYGKSFGVIDTENWKVKKVFKQIVRPDLEKTNSQSYADMTFDGRYIWIAWHLYHYKLPDSEVQQLLKINPDDGKIIERFSLPIGVRNAPDHGLTYDGETLWHIKGNKLSKINLNGIVMAQFTLKDIRSPSGLAWDGSSLWISESEGKLWKLPFRKL